MFENLKTPGVASPVGLGARGGRGKPVMLSSSRNYQVTTTRRLATIRIETKN